MKSALTRTKRSGETEGLYYTNRDEEFIRLAARWWCISADHYVRLTHSQSEWEAVYRGNGREAWRTSRAYSVTRRVNRLCTLDTYAPVTAARLDRRHFAYWCTSAGGELVGAPFSTYRAGNVSRALHSWYAADLALDLEARGYTVYSEREFASGQPMSGKPIPGGKFINAVEGSRSINPDHGKRPDFAVAGSSGNFILAEVERGPARGPEKYNRKLESYFANGRVSAVWYIVENKTTAQNVKAVAEDLSLVSRDMPVRVLRLNVGNFHHAWTSAFDSAACKADLAAIGAGA